MRQRARRHTAPALRGEVLSGCNAFVVFDIEVVFMLPLAMAYPDLVSEKPPVALPVMFFIALMAAGLFYEVKKDALNWNLPKSN